MRNTLTELHQRVARLELDLLASASALDRLQIGVIVADRSGIVLHANRTVRLLSKRADPPLIVTGPANEARLEPAWFHDIVSPFFRSVAVSGATRPLVATHPIRAGGGRLHSLIAPLTFPPVDSNEPRGAITIFVSDPGGHVDMSEYALRSLFGLTKTEARVARLLAHGMRMHDVGRRLGMSPATARWHVKHLLEKTGTTSQRHLACVLLASIAGVRQD